MNASTDPEPGTESFYAAVLFADISGFTAMTERLARKSNGAELLSQKLNAFFSAFLVRPADLATCMCFDAVSLSV